MKKIKYINIAFFLFIVTCNLIAQPTIDSQICFGTSENDYFYNAVTTNDNGFLASVYYQGTDGDETEFNSIIYPAVIIKFDSLLNVDWQKGFGGTDGYNSIVEIVKQNNM